jgi:4-amino-4-deoxy-L-arabinose transferase-like glycosyltransferase
MNEISGSRGPDRREPAAARAAAPRWTAAWLALILVASLVPRLPILLNVPHSFNSDEAVDALVIKHLLQRGELTLHNWDATYYGIVEGLLAVPFIWIDGYSPLAFKLSAVMGFFFLLLASYMLGKRLFGRAEGLAAAALLAAFSPQVVLWSTLASGGYTLVIAWGTLTLAIFESLRAGPRPVPAGKLALFGAMVGFGLYIYELYLVYVVALALYAATASGLWRFLLAPSRELRSAALRAIPGQLRAAAWLAAGIAVGWAPKLVLLFTGETGTKKPSYALADPDKLRQNLELLLGRCIPAFFGTNPGDLPEVARWVGEPWPLSRLLGILLLAFFAVAWLWGLRRSWPRIAGALRRPPAELDAESLAVLLVPIAALLFVLSPNPQDVLSSRYLLPWLSSVPIFGAVLLVRLGRRSMPAAAGLALFLVAFPLVQIARAQQVEGYLGPDFRLVSRREPLEDVVGYLRAQGVHAAYGPYWVAYEATFLSGESIVVAPFLDWDRYPDYTRRVQVARDVAYVFADPPDTVHRAFLERLRQSGKSYRVRRIGPYQVYTSPRRERLLPAFAFATPGPIARPSGRIAVLAPPGSTTTGEVLELPVRVTNTGMEIWSATGIGSGTYRVAVAYRWLDARGAVVVAEGERTLLPADVPPGGTVELRARVPTPRRPGSYRLVLTLVQESVAWFDQAAGVAAVQPLKILPADGASPRAARPRT